MGCPFIILLENGPEVQATLIRYTHVIQNSLAVICFNQRLIKGQLDPTDVRAETERYFGT